MADASGGQSWASDICRCAAGQPSMKTGPRGGVDPSSLILSSRDLKCLPLTTLKATRKKTARSQWKLTCQGKLEPRNYGNWKRNKHEKPSERQVEGVGYSSGKWERALLFLSPCGSLHAGLVFATCLALSPAALVCVVAQALPAPSCLGGGQALAGGEDVPL